MMRLARLLIDLLYPRRAACLGCGDLSGCERDDLCEACRRRLAKDWVGVCAKAGALRLDGAACAYHYGGPAGGLVRALKYRSARVLTEEMGRDLARAARGLRFARADAVCAVPMHPARLRKRGWNHAELLARAAAEALDAPYLPLLRRTRNAPQQARLDAQRRRENLLGGFAARADAHAFLPGATVLLIDDVLTTGATAAACAQALRDAGAARVYFAAYALARDGSGG